MALSEQRVIPTLRITRYESSKAFYLDQLGFELEWEHRFEPSLPVFMSVARDRMRLFLSEHAGDCQVGGLVHFVVEDVASWHHEFVQRGVLIVQPPNHDMGFCQMTVTDPDGNQLRFMESPPD